MMIDNVLWWWMMIDLHDDGNDEDRWWKMIEM